MVQLLLAAKADPVAAPKSHSTATPLMICAQGQMLHTLNVLLSCMSDAQLSGATNALSLEGDSLLTLCAQWSSDDDALAACAALVQKRANPAVRAKTGLSPAAYAANANNVRTARFLEEASSRPSFGADPAGPPAPRSTRRGGGGKKKAAAAAAAAAAAGGYPPPPPPMAYPPPFPTAAYPS